MQLVFFVLLSCLVSVYGQVTLGWTANFTMTSSANNSGNTLGTVRWRWSESDAASLNTRFLFEIRYQNPSGSVSTELYAYNQYGGYSDTTSQTKYADDTQCTPTCSTTGIPTNTSAMPPLDPTLGQSSGTSVTGVAYTLSGFFSTYPSGSSYTCATFIPRKSSVVDSFTASKTSGGVISICRFVINDDCIVKTYTLNNFVRTVPTISPPSSCVCNSVLDVMIVLDSSGSITPYETKLFHQFIVNFLKKLNIASDSVHVGIVWFSDKTGWMVGQNGPIYDIPTIAKSISNCTGSDYTIGGCGTPSGSIYPFETPCVVNDGTYTSRCGRYIPTTCTGNGVLYGSALLFSAQQQRKVPKLFITMTDGAVNHLVSNVPSSGWSSTSTPAACTDTCAILSDSANCTTQLKQIMGVVKTQYNNWLGTAGCTSAQCPLTFLSVGIGIELGSYCDPSNPQTASYQDPWNGWTDWIDSFCEDRGSGQNVCWDSNRCLSNQHLDILAGGDGTYGNVNPNVLSANNWEKLNNEFLPKLLALSCPDNQYSACACEKDCAGFCNGACTKCTPPSNCTPVNNLCYTVSGTPSGGKCPQIPTQNPCPATSCNCSKCVRYSCVSTANSGAGACVPTYYDNTDPCPPVILPGGTVSCKTLSCNVKTGVCDIPNTNNCPPCVNLTGECTGASCGPPRVNGTRTITQVSNGSDFCQGSQGSSVTESCCIACPCAVGDWSSWNGTCIGGCPSDNKIISRNRPLYPATCGGDSSGTACSVSAAQNQNCSDCTITNCVWEWGPWSCDCATGNATHPVIIISEPTNGGTPCPGPAYQSCTCCVSNWTETPCDCDTHKYNRTWAIITNGSGPAYTDCVTPNPTEYLNQPCQTTDPSCTICVTDSDCDDNNACTQDICDTNGGTTTNKHCRHVDNSSSCNLTSVCNLGYCDPDFGCRTTPLLFCDDGSVCTNDWCDDTLGCQHNESEISKNCSLSVPTVCNYAQCDPFVGCDYGTIQCNVSGNSNCTVAGCDPDWNSTDPNYQPLCKCEHPTGPCYEYDICGVGIGIIIGLTAGAIAALVVCLAFLAFLILSGGTYALAQQVRSHEDTNMNNNPLYQEKGTHGTNVFHAGNVD